MHEPDVSSEESVLPQRSNTSEMSDWDSQRGHGTYRKSIPFWRDKSQAGYTRASNFVLSMTCGMKGRLAFCF